ncbi:glycerate kinase [Labilibacter marinus]|uniref:glycerate kinase n=1 Tax=Labilibacter marinus TaxID=1477105 RepID=UPI000829B350|nr:glycerate kinase [Labilibacter marinus]
MQKIVIAPDKFKGSLTGLAFCHAVEKGIKKHHPEAEIVKLPLADGGDGTIEVLQYYLDGAMISVEVNDPLYRKINASYLYSESKKTAYIEMAEASGIRLLKQEELNPLQTTTLGTGQLIIDAMDKGAQHIILGIGGSATNDAGMGMAIALGYEFYDAKGNKLKGCGNDLSLLSYIDDSNVHPQLKNMKFDVACDVDNPLFGDQGAAHIYAPQKGANPEMVEQLNKGLINFNEVVMADFKHDLQDISSAGAAGGLGAGCVLFLNAQLNSGIELIKNEADFDNKIKDADWIITGEGKLDEQTFSGKVIKGVMDSLTDQKLAVFCGISDLAASQHSDLQISYLKQTSDYAHGLADSINNAEIYLTRAAEEFASSIL